MAASDARPQPIKNTAFRFYFSMRNIYGEFATETEDFSVAISKDGNSLALATNTPVEVEGDSGICYLDLTASEMNADAVCIRITATGRLSILVVLFPAEKSDFGLTADAGWAEEYNQHKNAGTFGKLMDILKKANTAIEGQVTAAVTPSATQFSTTLNYPDGAFEHAVLLWVDAEDILDQNSPILTYQQANGLITVEEAFTHVPEIGSTFVVIAGSHVHAIADINAPVLNVLSTTPATVLQPVSQSNQRIDIIRGDTYNDIRKPKLRFTVSKNYAGCTITLTVRHRVTDAILLTKTGAVDSSTILSVELTGTDTAFSTLPLDEYGLHVFDLQATDGSNNRETIILGGSAVLSLDQTR
jgi:hypothetical protein